MEQIGEEVENGLIERGGGGGKKRKKEFGSEHRDEKIKDRLAREAHESSPELRKATARLNERIFALIKKDKSGEYRGRRIFTMG